MLNKLRARLVLATVALAFLGTACDMVNPQDGGDCTVTADYKLACPVGDGAVIKAN